MNAPHKLYDNFDPSSYTCRPQYVVCVCVNKYVDCVVIGAVLGPVPAHRPLLQDQAPRGQSKIETVTINQLEIPVQPTSNNMPTRLLRDFYVMQMSSKVAQSLCFHLILLRLMLLERPPQDCRLHPRQTSQSCSHEVTHCHIQPGETTHDFMLPLGCQKTNHFV